MSLRLFLFIISRLPHEPLPNVFWFRGGRWLLHNESREEGEKRDLKKKKKKTTGKTESQRGCRSPESPASKPSLIHTGSVGARCQSCFWHATSAGMATHGSGFTAVFRVIEVCRRAGDHEPRRARVRMRAALLASYFRRLLHSRPFFLPLCFHWVFLSLSLSLPPISFFFFAFVNLRRRCVPARVDRDRFRESTDSRLFCFGAPPPPLPRTPLPRSFHVVFFYFTSRSCFVHFRMAWLPLAFASEIRPTFKTFFPPSITSFLSPRTLFRSQSVREGSQPGVTSRCGISIERERIVFFFPTFFQAPAHRRCPLCVSLQETAGIANDMIKALKMGVRVYSKRIPLGCTGVLRLWTHRGN